MSVDAATPDVVDDARRSTRRGVAWVVCSAVAYSLFVVFTKHSLEELRPTDVLFWRFVVAAPVVWVAVLARSRRRGIGVKAAPPVPFLAAGLVFGLVAMLAFIGVDDLSASLYTVIIYTYPAMVAIGATLLGRRQPRAVWFAVGLTTLGIALTVPQVFDDPDAGLTGLVFTLLNAALYAAWVLGTSRWIGAMPDNEAPADGLVASAWSATGSLVFALVVVAVAGVRAPQSASVWAGIVGLGVISTVVAGVSFFFGLARLSPPTAALIATLEPVLTLVWAGTILGETLVPLQALGAALVLAGVVWAQRASPVAAAEPG